MRIVACLVMAAGLLVCRQAKADDRWVTSSCDTEPRSAGEARALAKAPHEAKRIGKYELQVRWAKGVHLFKDKPPYGEELGNSWFAYCGTVAWSGMTLHILRMTDGDTFTGEMMDDATGKILPAGQTVKFSPDGQMYAGTEQPDGLDGENVGLFSRDGMLLWKGYGGVLAADGQTVVAEFDTVDFDAQGRLWGRVTQLGQPKQAFLLTAQPDGKWAWVVDTEKPPARIENHGLRVPVVH